MFEWYDILVFYFINYCVVIGFSDFVIGLKKFKKFDYELEIVCVIGREG